MAKRIYIKGVRHGTVDNDRLALAYLMLARVLVEQEEQAEAEPKPEETEPAEDAV
jgi:hypothetical protein